MESRWETDPHRLKISRSGFQGVCPYVVMVCVSGWLIQWLLGEMVGEKPLKSECSEAQADQRQYLRGFLMGGRSQPQLEVRGQCPLGKRKA